MRWPVLRNRRPRRRHDADLAAKPAPKGLVPWLIGFCLDNRAVVLMLLAGLALAGVYVAPFAWNLHGLPRSPVPVDAIPDLGENQQIVFTEWPGRSPTDIEDQVTYPLASVLLGTSGVKTVRATSMFGFSSIYVIFEENVDFYWSRTRLLERLSSLPAGTLPEGVRPTLGPDATPLGQVFWYTLEGRDPQDQPVGGWNLGELRSIQDWQVRYELMSVPGVAEVASVGGFVQEFQVELDPEAMRVYGVSLPQVAMALRRSNTDVGARTIEINRVEYIIRGLGLAESGEDLGEAVIVAREGVPVRVKEVGRVSMGPALRRGALDKGGTEAVGGVVVVRYGENPLAVIQRVKDRVERLNQALPSRTVHTPGPNATAGETTSKVTIVPFYDRTGLILQTLDTLNEALVQQVLVTIIVVVVLLLNLQSSALISGLLPIAVLYCFVAMRLAGVDANIVALSGIAIAIGTMVDMGIVLNENILSHLASDPPGRSVRDSVHVAASEVGGAVFTAVLTTVVSFLPVFAMQAAEGRLFKPLAYTKTFALLASLAVALLGIPPLAVIVFRKRKPGRSWWIPGLALLLGTFLFWRCLWLPGAGVMVVGLLNLLTPSLSPNAAKRSRLVLNLVVAMVIGIVLSASWLPLGVETGPVRNAVFVVGGIGGILLGCYLFLRAYPTMLTTLLAHKLLFLTAPSALVVGALVIWLGFGRVFAFVPQLGERLGVDPVRLVQSGPWSRAVHAFPGLGREFMPDLDEGAFLLMPTTMPHASLGEAMDVLAKQDMALAALPEINLAVGKIGRADSALDPAPLSMVETVIHYDDEYLLDAKGRRGRYRFDPAATDLFRNPAGDPVPAPDGRPYTVPGQFLREDGKLVADRRGKPFRLWRPALDPALNEDRDAWPGIQSTDDIWNEILRVTHLPGTTSAPKLQPIAARNVMLQSGMRAPMGVKVMGRGKATLEDIAEAARQIEEILREEPMVKRDAVAAERVVGKPYLELPLDRQAVARHGVSIADVQAVIRAAVGGEVVTAVQHGRERLPVLVRYQRELRNSTERLERVLITGADGVRVPLSELLVDRQLVYRRGPMAIKSENGSLVAYVLFDRLPQYGETSVVEAAKARLLVAKQEGRLTYAPGITWEFAGNYQNQIRSERRMRVVLPLALALIFLILYVQFRSAGTTFMVFSGILVAGAGGFLMIWLYGQDWFLDLSVFGQNLRDVFQMHSLNMSVAVWVGFIALFGIASDDGVVMGTYLDQVFQDAKPTTIAEVRALVMEGAIRRARPCLMTTATTILALLPVLTATGRGAGIMVPMAIPCFGGMCVELLTMFVVPVLYCLREEWRLRGRASASHPAPDSTLRPSDRPRRRQG